MEDLQKICTSTLEYSYIIIKKIYREEPHISLYERKLGSWRTRGRITLHSTTLYPFNFVAGDSIIYLKN